MQFESLQVRQGGANTRLVTPKLLEKALDEAIVRGHAVLYELMHRESELPGEWQYLCGFRERETQAAPEDLAVRRSLLRRQVRRLADFELKCQVAEFFDAGTYS